MKVSVKYVGDVKSNYTRYAITIPPYEKEIDLCKELGCDIERAEYIASQLKADSNIKLTVISTGGTAAKERKERVEKKAKKLQDNGVARQKLEKKVRKNSNHTTREDR